MTCEHMVVLHYLTQHLRIVVWLSVTNHVLVGTVSGAGHKEAVLCCLLSAGAALRGVLRVEGQVRGGRGSCGVFEKRVALQLGVRLFLWFASELAPDALYQSRRLCYRSLPRPYSNIQSFGMR